MAIINNRYLTLIKMILIDLTRRQNKIILIHKILIIQMKINLHNILQITNLKTLLQEPNNNSKDI